MYYSSTIRKVKKISLNIKITNCTSSLFIIQYLLYISKSVKTLSHFFAKYRRSRNLDRSRIMSSMTRSIDRRLSETQLSELSLSYSLARQKASCRER